MLRKKDKDYAKKRSKMWDLLGFTYLHKNVLNKNHSLNCGCVMCKMKTYYNRLKNKQDRLKAKQTLKKHETEN